MPARMRILSNVQIVRPGLHQETRHKLSGSMAGISRCEELCRHCDPLYGCADPQSGLCRSGQIRSRFEECKRKRSLSYTGLPSRSSRRWHATSNEVRLRQGSGASLRSRLTTRAKTGGKGIRTPGLLIANETLYQLSYTPE